MDWFKVARSRLRVEVVNQDLPVSLPPKARTWFYTPNERLVSTIETYQPGCLTLVVTDRYGCGQVTVRANTNHTYHYELMGWGEFDIDHVPNINDVIIPSRSKQEMPKFSVRTTYEPSRPVEADSTTNTILVLLFQAQHSSMSTYLEFQCRCGRLELTRTFMSASRYILTDLGYFRLSVWKNTLRVYMTKRHCLCEVSQVDYLLRLVECPCGFVVVYHYGTRVSVVGIFPTSEANHRAVIHHLKRSQSFEINRQFLITMDNNQAEVIDLTTDRTLIKLDVPPRIIILAYDEIHQVLLTLENDGLVAHNGVATTMLHPFLTNIVGQSNLRDDNLRRYQWCSWRQSLIVEYLLPKQLVHLRVRYE